MFYIFLLVVLYMGLGKHVLAIAGLCGYSLLQPAYSQDYLTETIQSVLSQGESRMILSNNERGGHVIYSMESEGYKIKIADYLPLNVHSYDMLSEDDVLKLYPQHGTYVDYDIDGIGVEVQTHSGKDTGGRISVKAFSHLLRKFLESISD